MPNKIRFALIGKDISHSKSKAVYEKLLDQRIEYDLLDYSRESDIPNLDKLFQDRNGISITAPYKTHFFGKEKIINCIRKNIDGSFEGTNTDLHGIEKQLRVFDDAFGDIFVSLLGNGSMAKVTKSLLDNLGIKHNQYSRKSGDNLSLESFTPANSSSNQHIIINACSREFNYRGLGCGKTVFWDFNYAHKFHEENLPSKFLKYINGDQLLIDQAYYALKFWGLSS